jgi:nucleoid-associated protein YgaU
MRIRMSARAVTLGLVAAFLAAVDVAPQAPLGVSLAREAHAVVGIPVTPVSVAGVARRTTRRVVAVEATAATAAAATTASATAAQQQAVAQQQAATAAQQQAVAKQQAATAQQQAAVAQAQAGAVPAVGTVVATLPQGCVGEARGGVEYYRCGSVYYRAAFQGNNLVYVVQQP